MKTDLIKKIEEKTGISNIVELLSSTLSGSELNSLLLEVFNQNLETTSPALLLKQYRANEYVQPAETDMIGLLTSELLVLEFLQKRQFQPIELSPAAQLGSCSVLASVDQKKIISAIRNTEILADATNAMALHIASLKKSRNNQETSQFCTVHRHVRCQPFKTKGFSRHFKIGCLVSAGRDKGSFQFETINLMLHLQTLHDLFSDLYDAKKIRVQLLKRQGCRDTDLLFVTLTAFLKNNLSMQIIWDEFPVENNYYKGVQYKMIIELAGQDFEIADGGFVDWTQQLLQNKKDRLLITGFGFELLYKIQKGLIS